MIDFSQVKGIEVKEGQVKSLSIDGQQVWVSGWSMTIELGDYVDQVKYSVDNDTTWTYLSSTSEVSGIPMEASIHIVATQYHDKPSDDYYTYTMTNYNFNVVRTNVYADTTLTVYRTASPSIRYYTSTISAGTYVSTLKVKLSTDSNWSASSRSRTISHTYGQTIQWQLVSYSTNYNSNGYVYKFSGATSGSFVGNGSINETINRTRTATTPSYTIYSGDRYTRWYEANEMGYWYDSGISFPKYVPSDNYRYKTFSYTSYRDDVNTYHFDKQIKFGSGQWQTWRDSIVNPASNNLIYGNCPINEAPMCKSGSRSSFYVDGLPRIIIDGTKEPSRPDGHAGYIYVKVLDMGDATKIEVWHKNDHYESTYDYEWEITSTGTYRLPRGTYNDYINEYKWYFLKPYARYTFGSHNYGLGFSSDQIYDTISYSTGKQLGDYRYSSVYLNTYKAHVSFKSLYSRHISGAEKGSYELFDPRVVQDPYYN